VPRHANALYLQTGATADLYVNNRQGNRNADSAIEHVVQIAVVRIVVFASITAKPLLFKNEFVERLNARSG